MKILMLDRDGATHERVATNLIVRMGDLGGMYYILMFVAYVAYEFFGQPFRNLHLSTSFNRMKSQICRQEGLIKDHCNFDEEFEKHVDFCFHVYLLLFKRLPCLPWCFSSETHHDEDDECKATCKMDYQSMMSHFDELNDQFKYQMSVRNLTT